jgi:hypothetical protein
LNDTLYVALDLSYFPPGKLFETTFTECIRKEAVSQLPEGASLLSQVLPHTESPKEWVKTLLQVTRKRYLFLFIDENGALKQERFQHLGIG